MSDLLTVMTILASVFAALIIKPVVAQLQRGGYSPFALFLRPRYFCMRYAAYFLTGVCFSAAYPLALIVKPPLFSAIFSSLYLTCLIIIVICGYSVTEKIPFVMTRRASRLYAFCVISVAAVTFSTVFALSDVSFFFAGLTVSLMPVFAPFVCFLAAAIIYPFEKINNFRYILSARNRLAEKPRLVKIAVTGSFGKTSVKNILAAMLATKYNVCATEGNYNTPLGIAKTVGKMQGDEDIFIAEFGARHVGDIKKLVKIVSPQYGIVTGVTGQHLETFKSLDNVYKEKFSLISSLPPDGFGFVNGNGIDTPRHLPEHAEYTGRVGDCAYVKDVKLSSEGSSFTLVLDNIEYGAVTKLLGAHNLDNICVAAAAALKIGVPPANILSAVKNLTVVPHRLQAIKNGGLTVIDDTYNANPRGVEEALNVLKQFEGRKIVVTPGMVELGKREDTENKIFGEKIAEAADLVILIGGTRAEKIRSGLLEKSFNPSRILKYQRLCDAENDFPKLFGDGDAVMFINDLPDAYY